MQVRYCKRMQITVVHMTEVPIKAGILHSFGVGASRLAEWDVVTRQTIADAELDIASLDQLGVDFGDVILVRVHYLAGSLGQLEGAAFQALHFAFDDAVYVDIFLVRIVITLEFVVVTYGIGFQRHTVHHRRSFVYG